MPRKKTSIIIKKKPSISIRRKITAKLKEKKQKKHDSIIVKTETKQDESESKLPKKSKILISKIKIKTIRHKHTRPIVISKSEDTFGTDKIKERSQELNADCFKIIRKIDPKGKLTREQLIYELETLRYKLKNKMESDPYNNVIMKYYNNVALIICDVKEKDIGKKVEINEQEKQKLIDSFKQKFKKMEQKHFARVVDLTAPKKDRKPEEGFMIWNKTKKVIYKDDTYKKPTNSISRQFNKFNVQKSMEDSLVKQLDERVDKNLHKYNIVSKHPNILKYQKYNPMTYEGLKWC